MRLRLNDNFLSLNIFLDNNDVLNMQNKQFTIWFTGLSGAGKTTLSKTVTVELEKLGLEVCYLDGDEVRNASVEKLGFSKEDRDKNIRLAVDLCRKYQDNGKIVVAGFISPYKYHRQWGRERLDNFVEIFVDASLEVCEKRDVKGMYKKARQGEFKNFTGISDVYEEPENPEIHLKTGELNVYDCVNKVMNYLKRKNLF